MTIEFLESAQIKMLDHLENTFPNEGCGFLFGIDGENRRVSISTPVSNSKDGDQRRRFEITPLEYMKAEQFALKNGFDLLGVYHSHPNHPSIPSEYDLQQALPHFSYVIVSIYDGLWKQVSSWRLKDQLREFQEESVILSKNQSVIN